MITIRKETPADVDRVRAVNEKAFGTTDEAVLVDRLREAGKAAVSLVATEEGDGIGHILFSPVTIEAGESEANDHQPVAVGLAPMAVLPECQNRGVGSALVKTGIEECRRAGVEAVVVLGHPRYYPRVGFAAAVRYNLKSEFDVADDVFMVLELKEGVLRNRPGVVKYQPEFRGF